MPNPTPDEAQDHIESIDQAIDLCSKMLRVDTTRRITAANALRHILFKTDENDEEYLADMEEDIVMDPRDGKCGHLHGFNGNKRTLNVILEKASADV